MNVACVRLATAFARSVSRSPEARRAGRLRRLDADLPIEVWLEERIFHGLAQLTHLDFQAADVRIGDGGFSMISAR